MTRRLKDIRHDLYAAASIEDAPIDDLIAEYHAVVRDHALGTDDRAGTGGRGEI